MLIRNMIGKVELLGTNALQGPGSLQSMLSVTHVFEYLITAVMFTLLHCNVTLLVDLKFITTHQLYIHTTKSSHIQLLELNI